MGFHKPVSPIHLMPLRAGEGCPSGQRPLGNPLIFRGCFAPRREALFIWIKSAQKAASLRLERFIHVLFRTQRQGPVLSPDSANCNAVGQKRLSLRRALWAYRSFGLGGCRLIHMKCGAIRTLVLLFHRSSSYGKTDGSTPLTGRQPKPDKKPGGDQMPEGFLIQWLDSIRIPPRPMRQGNPKP